MADYAVGTNGVVRGTGTVTGTSTAGIWSDVYFEFWLIESGGSNLAWDAGSIAYSVNMTGIGNVAGPGTFGFDWRPGGNQSTLIASGTQRVYHNADGTPPSGFGIGFNMGATGTSSAGGPIGFVVPVSLATLKVVPGTPSAVSAVRVSDTQATVSWSQSSATNGQPTTNTIRRKINGGAFADVVTIAPATSTNITSAANQKLVYGVKATNAAGASAWSADSTPIYTTPAAPTSVTATKVGSDIVIAWTPNVAFSEHQHLIEHGVDVAGVVTWDGSTLATKTAGTSTHTDTAPNPAQRHIYRVWAKNTDVGALISAKVQSNVVQLLAPPAKPAVPAPAAFHDKAATFRFAWVHNPVDSSTQTKHQTRYSTNGGSSWTTASKTTSANQYLDYAGGTFTANQQVLFQVRTKGSYDSGSDGDASYSPWSDSVTVTFKTKPVVTITSPANSSVQTQAALDVVLGFSQAESASFVSATIGLYDGATLVEEIISTTLAGTAFTTRLEDGGSYSVKATVTDSNGLVSSQVTSSFTVDYTEPVAAVVTVTYLADSGIAQIDLEIPAAGGGLVDADTVTIERVIDGVTQTIVANYPAAPTLTILDTTPTISGTNTYIVTTYSTDGASSVVTEALVTLEGEWAFLSTGAGYETIIRFRSNLEVAAAPSRESALIRTAGRVAPRALFGVGQGLQVTGSATLFEDGPESTPDEVEEFIRTAEVVCYRDPTGRRMFGVVSGAVATPATMMSTFSFSVTETA